LNRFVVARTAFRDIFLGWVLFLAAHVAEDNFFHAVHAFKVALNAPKASTCDYGKFRLGSLSWF